MTAAPRRLPRLAFAAMCAAALPAQWGAIAISRRIQIALQVPFAYSEGDTFNPSMGVIVPDPESSRPTKRSITSIAPPP